MKILITLKRVLNPEVGVKIKPDGSGVETTGLNYVINSFDEYAVEEGVRIIEKEGGEAILVCIGPDEAKEQLRAGLALGAERAVLVKCHSEPDSLMCAKIIAKICEREKPDLILAGKQSVDTDNAQTAQMLAALLSLPQGSCACKIEVRGGSALVEREVDGGIEVKEVPLPAVITADLRLNQPRYATLPAIMKAKRKEIAELSAEELGISLEAATRVVSLCEPPRRKSGRMVQSVEELFALLRDEARAL